MHTGNLLGQIPSPLPSEVFADLVSTNNVRIERILSQGQQTPTGEWFDQDEHEWVLLVQGEAILVFITPDTGVQERVHLGRGITSTSRRTFSTGWSGPIRPRQPSGSASITSKLTAQEGNASAAKIEEETVETKKRFFAGSWESGS